MEGPADKAELCENCIKRTRKKVVISSKKIWENKNGSELEWTLEKILARQGTDKSSAGNKVEEKGNYENDVSGMKGVK